jgi:hypothetical protein
MIKEKLKDLFRLYLPVYNCETDSMKVVYAGYSSLKRKYIVRLLLGEMHKETFMGRRWFWKIADMTRSSKSDIVISEISQIMLNRMYSYGGFILPEFVDMRINIDRPYCEIIQKGELFRNIMKKIKKYNLTYEILNGKESFSHFIDRFYLPFVKKRHGENARLSDVDKILNSTSSHSILAIKEDGMIVAEGLIQRSGDCLLGLQVGILDGNDEYRCHGVLGGIYYFSIIEGQRIGCRYYDVGCTPPFLFDGLTRNKIGLGAEFVPDHCPSNEYLWLGVNEQSDVAKEFINSHPFMYLNKDQKLVRCGI